MRRARPRAGPLWATKLGDDTAAVENAPFLQDGVAEGDVVRYRTDSDGLYWAVELVSSSGSCTNSTSVPRHTAQPQSPAARQRRVAQWSPNSAPIAHWLRVGWIVLSALWQWESLFDEQGLLRVLGMI
uniref:DUF4265 domain-containing protein n=1 Tax=Streptomyces cadmiisoli TaxID=2184053 RepID=UPI003D7486B6